MLQSVKYRLLVEGLAARQAPFVLREDIIVMRLVSIDTTLFDKYKNDSGVLTKSKRPKNRHDLHYIKMFPVTNKYLRRYRTEGNQFATLIPTIIDKNTKIIVDDCQTYLDAYAKRHHQRVHCINLWYASHIA